MQPVSIYPWSLVQICVLLSREYCVHNGDREEYHLANLDHQQLLIRNEGLLGYNENN